MVGQAVRFALALAFLAGIGAEKPKVRQVTVIINRENAVASVSPADLKRIYLGKLGELGGVRVVPINQTLDSDIAGSFLDKHVGMSSSAYKEYWIAQQVKGAGVAPMIQKTSVNVRTMVAQLPGAIGYVYADEVDSTVKAIEIK